MGSDYRYKRSIRGRFANGKAHAKYRGIKWHLGLKEFEKLLEPNECHYCKGPLQETGVGLDRKDNLKPYEISNVVPCCKSCNSIKGDGLSHSEMTLAMAVIKAKRGLSE